MACNCTFETNEAVIDKVRSKEMENEQIPVPFEITCSCGETFMMETHVAKCPACDMTFGVTPCKSDDINNVVMAKRGY